MVTGIFTGASGMQSQQNRLDAIANNLANLDTDGYKRDVVVSKSFAELLLRRMNDDGLVNNPVQNPFGSSDYAPIIGKLGTGVETNDNYTIFEQGALKETNSDFDMALDGPGFIAIQTPDGERYTRNGSFILGKEGFLETKEGYPVLGENGPIRVQENNFKIDKNGTVWVNKKYQDDPFATVSRRTNDWEDTQKLDNIKLVNFKAVQHIAKQGSSLWAATEDSGPANLLTKGERPGVLQGFTETANVNPVYEMVTMIDVNRAYEANQKTIQAEDAMLNKLFNEVIRL